MTPAEFNTALATIGWSKFHLAKVLECNGNITQRWGEGKAAIPPTIALWLKRLELFHEVSKPPRDWRKRGAGNADRCSQDTAGNQG